MRTRNEIEKDGSRPDILALEVLLDLRDLLKGDKPAEEVVIPVKGKPKRKYKRRKKISKET